MKQTITKLYDSRDQAERAVRELEAAGIRHDDISIIANRGVGQEGRSFADRDGDNDTAEGAGKGASTGAVLGGAGGLLAGLGMLAIPGLGPVVAAGWLASTAVGAVVGAVAGGAAGGLLGALKDAGVNDEDAHVYAEGVRRGGSLVSVRVDGDERAKVDQVLSGLPGVDPATRREAYRAEGWTGFDERAAPYDAPGSVPPAI